MIFFSFIHARRWASLDVFAEECEMVQTSGKHEAILTIGIIPRRVAQGPCPVDAPRIWWTLQSVSIPIIESSVSIDWG